MQVGLDLCREGVSTSPCSVPGLWQPYSTEFFLVSIKNSLGSSLCLLPLVLALGTMGQSLAPFSWPHPTDIHQRCSDPLSLLQACSPRALQGCSRCPHHLCTLLWALPAVPHLPAAGEPHTVCSTPDVPSPGQSKWKQNFTYSAGHRWKVYSILPAKDNKFYTPKLPFITLLKYSLQQFLTWTSFFTAKCMNFMSL